MRKSFLQIFYLTVRAACLFFYSQHFRMVWAIFGALFKCVHTSNASFSKFSPSTWVFCICGAFYLHEITWSFAVLAVLSSNGKYKPEVDDRAPASLCLLLHFSHTKLCQLHSKILRSCQRSNNDETWSGLRCSLFSGSGNSKSTNVISHPLIPACVPNHQYMFK